MTDPRPPRIQAQILDLDGNPVQPGGSHPILRRTASGRLYQASGMANSVPQRVSSLGHASRNTQTSNSNNDFGTIAIGYAGTPVDSGYNSNSSLRDHYSRARGMKSQLNTLPRIDTQLHGKAPEQTHSYRRTLSHRASDTSIVKTPAEFYPDADDGVVDIGCGVFSTRPPSPLLMRTRTRRLGLINKADKKKQLLKVELSPLATLIHQTTNGEGYDGGEDVVSDDSDVDEYYDEDLDGFVNMNDRRPGRVSVVNVSRHSAGTAISEVGPDTCRNNRKKEDLVPPTEDAEVVPTAYRNSRESAFASPQPRRPTNTSGIRNMRYSEVVPEENDV